MAELILEEFKSIKVAPEWLPIDCLVALSNRAFNIHQNRKNGSHTAADHQLSRTGKRNRPILATHWSRLLSEMVPKEKTEEPISGKVRGCLKKAKGENFLLPMTEKRLLETKARFSIEGDDEEHSNTKAKKIKKSPSDNNGPSPTPELPSEFRKALEEFAQGKCIEDLKLVIQKRLYPSDVNANNNRLSIPSRNILNNFLKDEEIKELEKHEGKNVKTIEADIIVPSFETEKVSLRRWVMPKKKSEKTSIIYNLTKTWNKIVSKNCLEETDIVQVWSARVEERLCFLLVKVSNS